MWRVVCERKLLPRLPYMLVRTLIAAQVKPRSIVMSSAVPPRAKKALKGVIFGEAQLSNPA